jgi:hypothetical protein
MLSGKKEGATEKSDSARGIRVKLNVGYLFRHVSRGSRKGDITDFPRQAVDPEKGTSLAQSLCSVFAAIEPY